MSEKIEQIPEDKAGLIRQGVMTTIQYRLATVLVKMRNKPKKFLIYPNKKLKRIAEPVDFDKYKMSDRIKIVRQMGATLGSVGYGMRLGIAAPQIGINLRVIAVGGDVMFNPTFTPPKNTPLEDREEACYSVPKRVFLVPRAKYGWAKWTDIDGNPKEEKITGMKALVFQHELAHLDGKCCIDEGREITVGKKEEEVFSPSQIVSNN
jgi:peptide deformylase